MSVQYGLVLLTHHHMKWTVGDVFASKPNCDDVFARFWSSVVNVECSIGVLNHIHIQLRPIRSCDFTGHFSFPSSLCVHSYDRFLPNLDGGADARS